MNSSSTRERLQRERISSWRSWMSACSTFSLSQSHCNSPSPPVLPFLPPYEKHAKDKLKLHHTAKTIHYSEQNITELCLIQSYLSWCCDNILSIGVTLKGLSEFAEQIDAHFNCIKFLLALCSRDGGGDKKCWKGSSQTADHWNGEKNPDNGWGPQWTTDIFSWFKQVFVLTLY